MALGGYCPVTLVATGERVVGKPLYWSNYDAHTYYCAHPGAAVAFMDNPGAPGLQTEQGGSNDDRLSIHAARRVGGGIPCDRISPFRSSTGRLREETKRGRQQLVVEMLLVRLELLP